MTSKTKHAKLIRQILLKRELARNHLDQMILILRRKKKPAVVNTEGSRELSQLVREQAEKLNLTLTDREVGEVVAQLVAKSRGKGCTVYTTYLRVAPDNKGIQIDIGDAAHTRIAVQPGDVSIIQGGQSPLFVRTPGMAEFVLPAKEGNPKLLYQYLNVAGAQKQLLVAWLTYTLALHRSETANYLHLIVLGEQGSGKTFLCNHIIPSLVDASHWGLQIFPFNKQDLVITLQNAHLSVFDNMRDLSPHWSDILCVAATGGSLSTRQLYTDRDELRSRLHGPMVLNGISPFINQADLAQRCLTVELRPLKRDSRKTELELATAFRKDLPEIFRGLLGLIAEIFQRLHEAEIKHPERMLEFVRWIAATELAMGIPQGELQVMYSQNLSESQHHSLMDNALGAAIMELIGDAKKGAWEGTPTELLNALTPPEDYFISRTEWPRNAVALSKRLKALSPVLQSQGVYVEFSRGKERIITIKQRGK
jgi:hypothetical protein